MSGGAITRAMRRAGFLLVNMCLLAGFWFGVALPAFETVTDQRGHIKSQSDVLVRLRSMADKGPMVEDLLSQSRDSLNAGDFLAGKSDGAVNAGLQAHLKSTVEAAGAQFRSVRGLNARTADSLAFTGARVEISGTLKSVQKAAHEIENARPLLFIVSAIVRPASTYARPQATAVAAGQPPGALLQQSEPEADAQFDVYGATLHVSGAP
jgi:Type II secretion system (T2SS), protein M subtype b